MAIKSVLRKDGFELNENKYLLASLMRACHLKNDRVHTKLPIRKGLLELLVRTVPQLFTSEQPYLVALYKAMLSTAYFGLFRVGELTAGEHVVKAADIHIRENKDKVMFVLHTSKTHGRDKKLQIIKIESNINTTERTELYKCDHVSLDPFELLCNYADNYRKQFINKEEQIFIFKDRQPVTPTHFRGILKKLLILNGLDHSLYSVQGTRAGRATDLLEVHKLSIETVRKLGRWKSSAIYTYLGA